MNIIQDTREQNGWNFEIYEECTGIIRQGLTVGDYTTEEILDLENRTDNKILRIERKGSTGELAGNVGKYYKRFERELVKLSEYEHAYIICEFPLDYIFDFPEHSKIPKKIWKYLKMDGRAIYSLFKKLEEKYEITVLYAKSKDDAEAQAIQIFKEVHDAYL